VEIFAVNSIAETLENAKDIAKKLIV